MFLCHLFVLIDTLAEALLRKKSVAFSGCPQFLGFHLQMQVVFHVDLEPMIGFRPLPIDFAFGIVGTNWKHFSVIH